MSEQNRQPMQLTDEQNQAMRTFTTRYALVVSLLGKIPIIVVVIVSLVILISVLVHNDLSWLSYLSWRSALTLICVGTLLLEVGFLFLLSKRTGLVWLLLERQGFLSLPLMFLLFISLPDRYLGQLPILFGISLVTLVLHYLIRASYRHRVEAERIAVGEAWLTLGRLSFWDILFLRIPAKGLGT